MDEGVEFNVVLVS